MGALEIDHRPLRFAYDPHLRFPDRGMPAELLEVAQLLDGDSQCGGFVVVPDCDVSQVGERLGLIRIIVEFELELGLCFFETMFFPK